MTEAGAGLVEAVLNVALAPLGGPHSLAAGCARDMIATAVALGLGYPLWRCTPRPGSLDRWRSVNGLVLALTVFGFVAWGPFPSMGGPKPWLASAIGAAFGVTFFLACMERGRLLGYRRAGLPWLLFGLVYMTGYIIALVVRLQLALEYDAARRID